MVPGEGSWLPHYTTSAGGCKHYVDKGRQKIYNEGEKGGIRSLVMKSSVPPRSRSAFTLVELLVVITIIGILIGLLMPAINAAREAARQNQCRTNLSNVALAALAHQTLVGTLPPGGWGSAWVGDPDAGYGAKQPGGFFYSILPHMDNAMLHDMGKNQGDAAKKQAAGSMCQFPVPIFNCPTRRKCVPTRFGGTALVNCGAPADSSLGWFHSDYVASAGDVLKLWGTGPSNVASGFAKTPDTMTQCTGVCFQASTVRDQDIIDGPSNTYLVGEKYLNADNYTNGKDPRDMQPALGGGEELCGWVATSSGSGGGYTPLPPMQDRNGVSDPYRFGSAHSNGFNVAFCDRSVRMISFTVDANVHRLLGNRRDYTPVDMSRL
jgi:prepilin-type N-terminal cleavage/methylation domain-containing protein/prepilin-type processing-associated H-X9-DG protein